MSYPHPMSDLPVPSTTAWYRSAFDVLYSRVYRHRNDDAARAEVDALCDLLDFSSGRVLDIACGAGRHLRVMRDRGMQAFGIDLSATLLGEAARRRDLGPYLARADVRRLPFENAFDLATNFFTSFGYFEAQNENMRALRSMSRTLRSDGRLVMDHVNRDHVLANLIEHDTQQVEGLTIESHRRIVGRRMVKDLTITDAQGRAEHVTESVRLYDPDEITAMFHEAGLDHVQLFGSFDGAALGPDKARMIVIGARA